MAPKEWREGDGTGRGRPIAPSKSRARHAARWPSTPFCTPRGSARKVFGGPKYTVSPIYEGMLKEEMDAAATRHPIFATIRS